MSIQNLWLKFFVSGAFFVDDPFRDVPFRVKRLTGTHVNIVFKQMDSILVA